METEGREREEVKKKEICVKAGLWRGDRTRDRHGGKQGLLGITLAGSLSVL